VLLANHAKGRSSSHIERVTTYIGYHERAPFLWSVDMHRRRVEPVADLKRIPQGIDELVPLDEAVAYRCGPDWFALAPDLRGEPRPLSAAEAKVAEARSVEVEVLGDEDDDSLVRLERHGEVLAPLQHPQVAEWFLEATIGPDNRTVAVAGSLQPYEPRESFDEVLTTPYEPTPSVLALVDTWTGDVRLCEGTFDNFCYLPAWAADGTRLAFSAPFERTRLYTVDLSTCVLAPIDFRRHTPAPLLDAALLPR
jgi:hypothetical protein